MRNSGLWLGVAFVLAGCFALDVPEAPGAGSIQGTVVFTAPGKDKAPAGGATVELLGTSLTTTTDPTTGFFRLSPIPASSGTLLIRFDSNGDGQVDRARTLTLESIQAGPGKVTALGEVVLSGTSSLRGTVLRSDSLASSTGHGGTSVFTPAGPYLVYTGDNGAFGIDGLPEGEVTVAFFRTGFRSQQTTITMKPGETFSLPTVLLTPESGTVLPVQVSGTASLFGASSSGGVKVTTNAGAMTTTASDGTWSLSMEPGVYVFGFEKDGFGTVTLRNIVVTGLTYQAPAVVLTPGTSTRPDLDGGTPYDGGLVTVVDAGSDDAGTDAGIDAGTDAGTDAGIDAGLVDAGSDAGTDAGTDAGIDAGLVDAGSDAGIDAGTDAGLVDAGSDAGVDDAGFDAGVDAGDPSADAGADAGIDAGLPIAIIDPLPTFKPLNSTAQLVGTNSTGVRPFSYKWKQTRPVPSPVAVLSANNSTTAANPTFNTGNTPTTYGFTLTVTDAFGRMSPESAEVLLPVGNPPTPNLINPGVTTVYANQVITFSGEGSSDPTGIIQYIWSVSPAGVFTTQQNGSSFTVTMPSTVTTPIALQVSLSVINGLGIPSTAPAVSPFITLTTASAPAWYVDAGQGQLANGGSVVTLNGVGVFPGFTVPAGSVTYQWSPAADPDGGWILSNPNSPITTFVAPVIVGPNRFLPFTLTVTTDAGLTPSVNTGSTFVNVQDKTPPVVLGTSISGGRAGTLGLTVDFSEPVDLTSINNITISGTQIGARYLTNKGTRAVLVTWPMDDGASYTLNISSVFDLAPSKNFVAPQSPTFVAQSYVSPAFESTMTTTADPRPGGALRKTNSGANFEVVTWGRDGVYPFFSNPFDPQSCDAGPCTFGTDLSAPKPTLTPLLTRGPRTIRVGNTVYATAQPRDFVNDAGQVTFERKDSTWVQISPPGNLFTDNFNLYATVVESGLKVMISDGDGGWNLMDGGVATTDGTFYSTDSTSDPYTLGSWSPGVAQPLYIAGKGSKSVDARSYKLSFSPTTWTQYGPSAGLNTTDMRIVANGSGNLFGSHPNGSIDYTNYGATNNYVLMTAANGSGFDAMLRGSWLFWVMSVNGQIVVRWNNNSQITVVPGPGGADTFNNNPACFADSPEFTTLDDKVGITWAERCGTGPWRVYFRLLN